MSDIFVSYASEDRPIVAEIVGELEDQGWTVWWDRHIETGATFDVTIERAIEEAQCILVVWSASSIRSDWVRAEAAEGLERNILIPVLVDDVKPPLLFRQKQALSLIEWKRSGTSDVSSLSRLVGSIGSKLASDPALAVPVSTQRAWVLGEFRNETDIEILGSALHQGLELALMFFDGMFQYIPDHYGKNRTWEAVENLAEEEGLDGFICGNVKRVTDGYTLSITVIERAGEESTFSAIARREEELLDALGKVATDASSLLQRATSTYTDEMCRYLKARKLESLHLLARSYKYQEDYDYQQMKEISAEAHRIDPGLSVAYRAHALACINLGQLDEAKETISTAVSIEVDSPRNRHFMRGLYYVIVTEDHDKAATEFQQVLNLSPLDPAALNNLAVCRFYQLDFETASELGNRDLELYPTKTLGIENAALYAMYAGDFSRAAQLAQRAIDTQSRTKKSRAILAIIEAHRGDAEWSRATLEAQLKERDSRSFFLTCLADLMIAERNWQDAERYLDDGVVLDENAGNKELLARKLLMRAELAANSGRAEDAAELVSTAIRTSSSTATLALAGVTCAIHRINATKDISAAIRRKVDRQGKAYARMVTGIASYLNGDIGDAVEHLRVAIAVMDLWMVRLMLAVVFKESGLVLEAQEQFAHCKAREGEGLAATLDDIPTVRLLRLSSQAA